MSVNITLLLKFSQGLSTSLKEKEEEEEKRSRIEKVTEIYSYNGISYSIENKIIYNFIFIIFINIILREKSQVKKSVPT